VEAVALTAGSHQHVPRRERRVGGVFERRAAADVTHVMAATEDGGREAILGQRIVHLAGPVHQDEVIVSVDGFGYMVISPVPADAVGIIQHVP